MSEPISKELQERLQRLEKRLLHLQEELKTTEKLAKQLQGLVSRSRFPQIQGIDFLSRYIPGEQNRAEGFDMFMNTAKTSIWFFYFNLQSYGLSSSLFQVYLLLQSRSYFDQPDATSEKAISELLKEFSPKDDANAQIFVASLQLSTLKWSSSFVGQAPLIAQRRQEMGAWSEFERLVHDENKSLQLSPGSRVYFLNFANKIPSEVATEKTNQPFKEDFHELLFEFEKSERSSPQAKDICFWGIDISARKIHLA